MMTRCGRRREGPKAMENEVGELSVSTGVGPVRIFRYHLLRVPLDGRKRGLSECNRGINVLSKFRLARPNQCRKVHVVVS
jgi:hypothetical protein